MTVQLSENQSELIKTIARENGITDNFDVDTSPGSKKGDNYIGLITKVTIKKKQRTLELILKSAPISKAFRKAAPIRNVFCREIYLYKKVFVEFEQFQDEFNILNPFTGHAKLFATSSANGKECLVMENMLETSYKHWNRKIPMDSEHMKAVFIEYAKFHSISLAMAHKKSKLFNDLTRDIEEDAMQQLMDNTEKFNLFIKSVISNSSKALENDPDLLIVLKKFEDGIPEYFLQIMKNTKWNLVVNHGDSWCTNLMFKYEGPESTSKVSKVCILDWQFSKKGSPAADLTYFFLAHSPKEVLYDYKRYLTLYHDTVCKSLRDFLCDPEKIFPFSLLEQHWRKFINFGIFFSLMQMKVMQCETDEVPDLSARTESGEDMTNQFPFDLKNAVEYNQRVKDMMKFVTDTGLLSLNS